MPQEILVIVEGGLIQEIYGIPPEVVVRVKDYDVDPRDDPDLLRDRDGEPYCEAVRTAENSCGPSNVTERVKTGH